MGLSSSEKWLEAQQGVLGAALIEPKVVPIVLSQTTARDYSGTNMAVFHAMSALMRAGVPVDPITVVDKLGDEYRKYIVDLMQITPTAANVQAYIDLAKKQARIYRLQEIGALLHVSADPDEQQKLLEDAVAVTAEQQSIQAVSIYQAYANFIDRHADERTPDFLPWPIPQLNDLLYIEPGDFVLLAGKPSAGKTAFALQCAWTLSEKYRVGFFSLETGEKKLADRQISSVAGVPLENIKRHAMNQQHWDSIIALDQAFKGRKLDIITKAGIRVTDLQAYATARRYDVIFIDYVHLLSENKRTPYEEISRISMSLHRFAQTAGCCVIGLSQLNRGGEGKKGIPDMSWLRDSGQLEQDADAVLILYLEDEKNPASPRVLKCAKNKEGERFNMRLTFDGKTQKFSKMQDFGGVQRQLNRMARERKQEEQLKILSATTPLPDEFTRGE